MIYIVDGSFRVIGVADVHAGLAVRERYDGRGEGMVKLPRRHMAVAVAGRYLLFPEWERGYVIEKVTECGDGTIEISCKEVLSLLAGYVIRRSMPSGGGLVETIRGVIEEAGPENIEIGEVCESEAVFGGGEMGEDLLSFCLGALQAAGMTLRMRAPVERDAFVLSIEPLADLGERVMLAQGGYEAKTYTLVRGYGANVAMVRGEDAGGLWMLYEVDRSEGEGRREVYVDGSSVKRVYRDGEGARVERSEEEYLSLLRVLGERSLEKQMQSLRIKMPSGKKPQAWVDYQIGDAIGLDVSGAALRCRCIEVKKSVTQDGMWDEILLGVLLEE